MGMEMDWTGALTGLVPLLCLLCLQAAYYLACNNVGEAGTVGKQNI
jgi:hypothetical protein